MRVRVRVRVGVACMAVSLSAVSLIAEREECNLASCGFMRAAERKLVTWVRVWVWVRVRVKFRVRVGAWASYAPPSGGY